MKVRILLFTSLLGMFFASCGGQSPADIETQARRIAATMLATSMETSDATPSATATLPPTQTARPVLTATVPTATVPSTDTRVAGVTQIVEAYSKISGETLEIVLQLQDLPSELTFNQPGVDVHEVEYSWGASVDVDNDPQTGDWEGYEYSLEAFFATSGGEPFTAPIQDAVQAYVLENISGEDSYQRLSEATISVDPVANTITLSGHIPGLMPESRVHFDAHESSDHYPATKLLHASSQLSGEILEVVLGMPDLPPELIFQRPGVPNLAKEYEWGVRIDVDNNRETGDGDGFDYRMSAYYRLDAEAASEQGCNLDVKGDCKSFEKAIQDTVKAEVWKCNEDGCAYISDATLVVDTDLDTITLHGSIPGISSESYLHFYTFDYFGGEMSLK
jgi:hypothetical protein